MGFFGLSFAQDPNWTPPRTIEDLGKFPIPQLYKRRDVEKGLPSTCKILELLSQWSGNTPRNIVLVYTRSWVFGEKGDLPGWRLRAVFETENYYPVTATRDEKTSTIILRTEKEWEKFHVQLGIDWLALETEPRR